MRSRGRFCIAVAGAAAATAFPSRARSAAFEFKCATNLPVDHPTSVRLRQMWTAVERESGGVLRTQLFPAGMLGTDPSLLAQVRVGAIHFFLAGASFGSVVPSSDVANLGFAFKDTGEAFRAMDGPLGEYVRNETAAKGLYAIPVMWNSGMLQVGSNTHPIAGPDDFRGFKLRGSNSKILDSLFALLGASPTTLSPSETYTALQTKLVDGEGMTIPTIVTARLFEVNKYISLTNHAWSGEWLVANGDAWKGLPAAIQAIVERNNRTYAKLERRDTMLLDASLLDKLRRQGLTVNRVDRGLFTARLKPYFERWSVEFGATVWGLLQESIGRKLP